MFDFSNWPIAINFAIFAAAATVVWISGTKLVRLVDRLGTRTGIGHAFLGMLLLGGMVSLTEIATVSTAAFTGSPSLALNNLLGSVSINVFLLAIVDPISGREALTSFIARPAILFQSTLVIVLMVAVAMAITTGDYAIGGVGAWSSLIFAMCLLSLWLSFRYQRVNAWRATDDETPEVWKRVPPEANESEEASTESLRWLIFKIVLAGAIIFSSGFALSLAGEAIARQTGLGASFVGFVLVGISTSLPELSSIVAAVRIKRYEMAVGDILGSNVFNVLLIFLAEVVYRGEPVLNHGGQFEIAASLLGVLMTGILLLGLLERRDRTILKMGYDSLALICTFVAGLVLLYFISRP